MVNGIDAAVEPTGHILKIKSRFLFRVKTALKHNSINEPYIQFKKY
jgi:hypothetical protein